MRNMKGPLRSAPANPIAYLLLSPNFSLLRPRPYSMLIDEHFPVASWRERETENPAVSVSPLEYRNALSKRSSINDVSKNFAISPFLHISRNLCAPSGICLTPLSPSVRTTFMDGQQVLMSLTSGMLAPSTLLLAKLLPRRRHRRRHDHCPLLSPPEAMMAPSAPAPAFGTRALCN